MKPKKNLYTIKDARVISCLGGITGPIQHPTEMKPEDVITLVRNGFTVFQHNPHNLREKVKVTRNNFNTITFKTSQVDGYLARALNRELRNEAKKVSAPAPEPKKESKENKKEKSKEEAPKIEKPVNSDFETQS